jgi:hypothetical protein
VAVQDSQQFHCEKWCCQRGLNSRPLPNWKSAEYQLITYTHVANVLKLRGTHGQRRKEALARMALFCQNEGNPLPNYLYFYVNYQIYRHIFAPLSRRTGGLRIFASTKLAFRIDQARLEFSKDR